MVVSQKRGFSALALAGILCAAALGGDGDAVVIVNGAPISQKQIVDRLMEAHGLSMMQQMIVLELARQEATRRQIRVSQADIEREFEDSLDEIARESGLEGPDATRENKLRALQIVLDNKRISMEEYKISVERNAYLRPIAQQDVQVDDATLREEFARTYGERVVVRHIQIPVSDRRTLLAAETDLRQGADFADVARRLSANPRTAAVGGELEPFTFTDTRLPAIMREIAFSLRPGEQSNAVQTDTNYQILRLERRIPPDNVRFEEVRDQVRRSVVSRATAAKMQELAVELFQKATIKVIDRRMKDKYEDFLKKGQTPTTP
jgi:parvulin-like peptidyl-prolyl isomerase